MEAAVASSSSGTSTAGGGSTNLGGWQSDHMVLGGFDEGMNADTCAVRQTGMLETVLPEQMQKEWGEPWSPARPVV